MTLLSDVEHLRGLLAEADLFAGMPLERIPQDLIFATLNRLPRLLDAAERDGRRCEELRLLQTCSDDSGNCTRPGAKVWLTCHDMRCGTWEPRSPEST